MPTPRTGFGDGAFDPATAVETVYFWRDKEAAFREIFRVLKPGGLFAVILEAVDNGTKASTMWSGLVEGMEILPADALKTLLLDAGFADVEVYSRKPSCAAILARKAPCSAPQA